MSGNSRKCAGCGTEIVPGPRERNKKKWCSEACRVKAHRNRNPEYVEKQAALAKAKHRAAYVESLKDNPTTPCQHCGESLRCRRDGWAYCSKADCQSAKRDADKASKPACMTDGCERPTMAKGLCGSHYSLQWRKLNPDKHLALNHRYRSNKRGAWVEDVSRKVVLERDGWICHLCEDGIPKDVTYPHHLYGSLDHVIPLSKGGTHEYANVKAAHFLCNSLKSDNENWKPSKGKLIKQYD